MFFCSILYARATQISRNDKSQGYYVTYMPFSEFGPELRSQNTFADPKLALKDAKNKNYFRAKLVNNCQTEFQLSTQNVSLPAPHKLSLI